MRNFTRVTIRLLSVSLILCMVLVLAFAGGTVLIVEAAVEDVGNPAAAVQKVSTDVMEGKGNSVSYISTDEAVLQLREYLKQRKEEITLYVKTENYNEDTFWNELLNKATQHTGEPTEGDYLAWHLSHGTNEAFSESVGGQDYVTFSATIKYNSTAEEEAAVDLYVDQLLDELNVDDATDYEKVRAIYDWICLNVKYDTTLERRSAYDALVENNTVCQGYALLFYRLCLELGVDCRICSGMGGPKLESHGWNVVQVDGNYYFVDATWGAELIEDQPDYYYLLKGSSGFDDHIIPADTWEEEIGGYCIVQKEDYWIPEKDIILTSGNCTDTITYSISKAGILTIQGSGELSTTCGSWTNWFKNEDDLGCGGGWLIGYDNFIRRIEVGEGITRIGNGGDTILPVGRSIVLPSSLLSVDEYALYTEFTDINLKYMTIHLPEHLQSIDGSSLCAIRVTVDPQNKHFVVHNNSLYSYDMKTLIWTSSVDENFTKISDINVPDGVEKIGKFAFFNRDYQNVCLSDSVQSIEENAFSGCRCSTLSIGKSLSEIGTSFFGETPNRLCGKADAITVDPDNKHFVCSDGVLFNKEKTILIKCMPGAIYNQSYVVPDGITEITPFAFRGCELRKVVFPESLLSIGNNSFQGTGIAEFELPQNLEYIGKEAFRSDYLCQSISNVIMIPNSVKRIDEFAFYGHTAEIIMIGKGLEHLGDSAFIHFLNASQNENVEMRVYFFGKPPESFDFGWTEKIFAYNDPVWCEQQYATILYHLDYQEYWAANGEASWQPDPDTPWHSYPLKAFYHYDNCAFEVTVTPPSCKETGSEVHYCALCGEVLQLTIPTTSHTYTDGLDGTCNGCGIHREETEDRTVMHMFRMYDPNSGEHFYTGSEVERENLVAAGWNYEGVGFTFSRTTGMPVYRLYDPISGEHLYTMQQPVKTGTQYEGKDLYECEGRIWLYEGIAFNSAYDTEVPQYRLRNPNATRGAYHFTSSAEERDNLIAAGWISEGICFYSSWK